MPINLALVGCAHPHVTDYLRIIDAHDSAKIAYVWDRMSARMDAIAKRTGARPIVSDETPQGVGGALILSETRWHLDDVARAMSWDCPVFVEKPIALDPVAAADLLRGLGPEFHCGFFLRTIPALQELSGLLRTSSLGPIGLAKIRFSHNGLRDGWMDPTDWITDPVAAGFGGFGDLAVHCIDLLTWLDLGPLGDGQVRLTNILGLTPADDFGAAIVDIPGGKALIEAGWADRERPMFELHLFGRDGCAFTHAGQLWVEMNGAEQRHSLGAVIPDAGEGLLPWLGGLTKGDWTDCVSKEDATNAVVSLLRLLPKA